MTNLRKRLETAMSAPEVARSTDESNLPAIVQDIANRSVYPHMIPLGPKRGAAYVHGLTKRELLAAMAMQGILSNSVHHEFLHEHEKRAQIARLAADELLKELAK